MDKALHLPNQINHAETKHPITLDSVCRKPNLTAGELIVAAGVSGLQRGHISQCSASLWHRGSFLNVRQVTLDNAPREYLYLSLSPKGMLTEIFFKESGDSGSWATRGSQVCGQIVAAREGLPWAYMLPMYHILDDIKAQLKASDVSIMTGNAVEAFQEEE